MSTTKKQLLQELRDAEFSLELALADYEVALNTGDDEAIAYQARRVKVARRKLYHAQRVLEGGK